LPQEAITVLIGAVLAALAVGYLGELWSFQGQEPVVSALRCHHE
jgi:hypothetical protein